MILCVWVVSERGLCDCVTVSLSDVCVGGPLWARRRNLCRWGFRWAPSPSVSASLARPPHPQTSLVPQGAGMGGPAPTPERSHLRGEQGAYIWGSVSLSPWLWGMCLIYQEKGDADPCGFSGSFSHPFLLLCGGTEYKTTAGRVNRRGPEGWGSLGSRQAHCRSPGGCLP